LLRAIAPLIVGLPAGWAWGAPQGGRVVAGSAVVSSLGNTLLVRQSSSRAIINWTDFSIGASETVRFVLPSASSAVLNRVVSLDPSELNGTLQSNGSVYLINPNGVLVGPQGQIDVHGFIASALDVSGQTFMAGGDLLFSGDSTAAVVNRGIISTPGGDVVFIARQVGNSGQISAAGGSVNFAGGGEVLLQQAGTPGITVRVLGGTGAVTNTGIIQTTVAQLTANGGNAMALAINNTGIIRATGVNNVGGHIRLTAAGTGQVDNNGTLDASSTTGQGGQIVVTGQDILIGSESRLNASGAFGGGEILVGGSWENDNPMIAQAVGVMVQPGARIDASATQSGDGGTIVVRSDVTNPISSTRVYGELLADGAGIGNGGRIETSGYSLETGGATVSASAPDGHAGEWLLDPYNVTISSSPTSGFDTSGSPWVPTTSGGNVAASDIEFALNNGSNVTISTGSSGSDLGNITDNAAISKTSGGTAVTLELEANNNITINQDISSTSGALNLIFDAHQGTSGAIVLGANLTTNGGYINFGTGRTSGGALVGGDVYFNGTSAQTISTSGGAVTFNGQILIANPDGLTVTSGGADITFQGTVDSGDTYSLVNDSENWDTAEVDAKGSTGGAAAVGDTYLATITSSLENTIASNAANYTAAWLGGHRVIGIGTNAVWRWVTGPEGLEDSGNGLPFFTSNPTGGGGTPINGAFTNWNGGEPNNSGGANINDNGESALQFLGSNALWNDLSESDQYLPYLVETNLAPSALAVNAGAGHVTFNGFVGGNKALASLTVTGATAMNGGGVTTTGAQTYNNPVALGASGTVLTVTSGNLNLSTSITYSGSSAASLSLVAFGDVTLSAGSAIEANGAGALNIALDADSDANQQGNIQVIDSAISSNGGAITLGGGGSPSTTAAYGINGGGSIAASSGVFINQSTLNSAGGNISIIGTGSTSSTPDDAVGVVLEYGSSVDSGAGTVTIVGVGATGGTTGNMGVNIRYQNSLGSGTAASSITSDSTSADAIVISGTGSTSGALNSAGFTLQNGSSITADGVGGGITINGTGGTFADGSIPGNHGINLDVDTTINAVQGDITLNASSPSGIAAINNYNSGTRTVSAGDTLTLNPGNDGADLDSTELTAPNLLLTGAGSFTLTDASNAVGTIAGDVTAGSVQFTDSSSLIVGSISGTTGLTDTTGAVTLVAPGASSDITLDDSVAGAGAGATVVLDAGRNFINDAGASDIDPGSGRFLVYSTTPVDSVLDGLSGGEIYDSTYTGNPPSSVTESGDQFLYSIAPTLTFTATDQTKVYAQANPTLTYSVSGFVGTDTIGEAVSGAPLVSTSATSSSGIGNYTIDIAGNTLSSLLGYSLAFDDGNLSVTAAPLTITAVDKSKVYGAALPTLTASYSGLVNGDGTGVISGLTLSTSALASSNVGAYGITAAGATSDNYDITFDHGTLTITEAPLTITADDLSKVYGAALPTLTANYAGLVNGDGTEAISGLTLSTSALASSNVGAYGITASGATSGNYNIMFDPGTLTITKAPLTITADDLSKVYGAALPTLTANYTGLVNGDGTGAISGLTLSTSALASSNVGSYGITASGATSGNYNITLDPGTLTITTAPLTITANDQSKAYGDALPTLTASYSGLVNGDGTSAISGLTLSTSALASSNVGAYGITASGATSGNYNITLDPGTLAITKVPLTITANDQSKVYGAALPMLTADYSGLVNGDGTSAISGLTLSTSALASSNVGAYGITASGATSGNYNITLDPGTLTITKAPLTITANDLSKVYGAALPTLTAGYTGLVNGDGPGAISGLSLSTSALASSSVGNYGITASGATSGNYSIALFPGTLAITQAPLFIQANDKIRDAGQPNAPLTATFLGLVNGDQPSSISGLTLATAANTGSPVGAYPIEISGATNGNYAITMVDGTLDVLDGFTQSLRTQWQTDTQLAPNFAVGSITQPAIASQAQTSALTATASATPSNPGGNVFLRDRAKGMWDQAVIQMGSKRIVLNTIVDVSSFDQPSQPSPSKIADIDGQ
jgi:filamentous hemagglutinin family protein